ncbi:MAG: hypothetical protein P9L93_07210 [Candidatus Gorgyraea atricola]|nr:hypothetical protein [Candidatus Gorgyraea atricola]
MITIRKVYYIGLIFTLIAMLAAGDVVCAQDLLRPYMQLEAKTKKPNRRQRILGENEKEVEYLGKIATAASRGENALEGKARMLFERLTEDPESDLLDTVEFDKRFITWFYAVFNPYEPTKVAKEYLEKYPGIFNQSYDNDVAKIKSLFKRIFHAAALKELDLSKKNIKELEQYMILHSDSLSMRGEKIEKMSKLLKTGKPKSHKEIFYKYCSIIYRFYEETCTWNKEISGPADFDRYGDEYGLNGGLPYLAFMERYRKEHNLMEIHRWLEIGKARYCILNNNIPMVIEIFERLSEACEYDVNSPIRQTLLWTYKNGLPGLGQIVEELGMDGICVEEIGMLMEQLSDFLDNKEELVDMPEPIYDVLIKGHLGRLIEVESLNVVGITALKQTKNHLKSVIMDEYLTEKEKLSIINDWISGLKIAFRDYRNIVKVFLNTNVLLKWAKLLAESKNEDKNKTAQMLKDEDFRNRFMRIMSEYLQLVNHVQQSFNEIIPYFQMRLEMEQGVGEVLESNGAVEVAI